MTVLEFDIRAKRRKLLKKTIKDAEGLLKDLEIVIKTLDKYKDYGMIRPVYNEIGDKHKNIFQFIIKKTQELGKLTEAKDGNL